MGFLDFLFPPLCPHCGAPVVSQGRWCDSCIDDVLHIRQVPQKFLHSLDKVWILADYRGGIKSMIYDVKFNAKKEQSKGAAPFLASYNLYVHEYMPHYIVPIPSSEEKKKIRGYNQVDLFFMGWANCLEESNVLKENECFSLYRDNNNHRFICSDCKQKVYEIDEHYFVWLDCLYKMDTHKDMWRLTGTERLETVKHAFMWNREYNETIIKGKRILLVDDIYTTGATLESAGTVLRQYKPASIESLTLASGSF